jgi:hypothetical protein
MCYAPRATELANLERLVGLRPDQLPREQLATLLWASYFVGMEWPGHAALLTDLLAVFEPPKWNGQGFRVRDIRVKIDERFDVAIVSAAATGARLIRLHSLVRESAPQRAESG